MQRPPLNSGLSGDEGFPIRRFEEELPMTVRRSFALCLAILCCGLLATPVAVAQTTGDIEGTVSDANNAPLPGVSVEIKSPALQGSRVVPTDSAGRFRFPAL